MSRRSSTARTTRRCRASSSRRTTARATSPSRTCRSASSGEAGHGPARIGCAIGDSVLDLLACAERGLLRGLPTEVEDACRAASLNALMAIEPRVRGTLRHRLSHLLRADGGFVTARNDAADVLVRRADAEMLLPAAVGDYTDFYASLHHATNVGKMLRPDNPLLPELQVGADRVPRPRVLARRERHAGAAAERADGARPPARRRPGSARAGTSTTSSRSGPSWAPATRSASRSRSPRRRRTSSASCLVNDWSARDLQKWEYQPLGPFLAKSFATTVSPWVVTLEALAPFRGPLSPRPEGDPAPLPHLRRRGRPRARRLRPAPRGAAR